MKIKPNDPAFPQSVSAAPGQWSQGGPPGLTIRAYIATQLMAGKLGDALSDASDERYVKRALLRADMLIAALNAEPKP